MVWWPFAPKPERVDTSEVTDLHSGAPPLYSTVNCLFPNFASFASLRLRSGHAFAVTSLLLTPTSLHAQEPLRAGTIFSATQAPLWAAKEGRYFEKYGIKNLEVIQFSGGQPVTRALIGGDIQISATGGAAVINARLKGADAVIIARTVGVFPYTLYVGKEIRDAAGLKGKKLAVSTVGGSGYVAAQYALRKLGLDPDKDVAMLQVGDFGTRLASLAAGTVQGTLLLPPFSLRAKEMGLRPLYDLVGSGIRYPIHQITTRQSFIKSQRDTVKNFMKGFIAGLARFRTDRDFGMKVLGKNLRETDAKISMDWDSCFGPRISAKPVLDEIDRALRAHYGFTDEEFDFINYDIKCHVEGLGDS